jgi:hypothetical protein
MSENERQKSAGVSASPEKNYAVIGANGSKEFTALVGKHLALGWICQGGLAVSVDPETGEIWMYQAMDTRAE